MSGRGVPKLRMDLHTGYRVELGLCQRGQIRILLLPVPWARRFWVWNGPTLAVVVEPGPFGGLVEGFGLCQ